MAFELPSLGTSSELLWSQPTWFNSTLPVTRMLKRAGLSIAPRNNEGQEHRNFNRLGRPNRIQIASQGVKNTEGHWPRSGRKEMRVFVAGASGAVGKRLIPELVKAGHKVIGMTRSAEKRELVQSMGADHVAADALDRQAVLREVRRARPDVVVHEMTAIPKVLNLRSFDREFALTNRLRTEGTTIYWRLLKRQVLADSWPRAMPDGHMGA